MDEQQKRLERRKEKLLKCLALSKSAEPHEAAAAMRQAQKLMAELNLSEADLLAEGISSAEVKTREGFGSCRLMDVLTTVMQEAFAVEVVYSRNPGSAARLNVSYIGPKQRVQMAEYCHRVVWRALMTAWDQFLEDNPEYKGVGGQRQSFCEAWLWAVKAKVSALVITEDEARAIVRFKEASYKNLTVSKPARILGGDDLVAEAGLEAAQGFNIYVPLDEEQLALTQS